MLFHSRITLNRNVTTCKISINSGKLGNLPKTGVAQSETQLKDSTFQWFTLKY